MALFVVLKLISVTTSYGSGNAGVFRAEPFYRCHVGRHGWGIAHHLLPEYTASAGAYALVGMGTLFAGIVRAPMTSVWMIFDTTQDYAVIVPLDDFESLINSSFLRGCSQLQSMCARLSRRNSLAQRGNASSARWASSWNI